MIKAAFLSDSFKRGIFSYSKVGTKDQLADAFTKPLPRDDFIKFRELMGVEVFELERASFFSLGSEWPARERSSNEQGANSWVWTKRPNGGSVGIWRHFVYAIVIE